MSRTEKPAASKSPTLGIDVSRFQGTIDWDLVARARIRNPVTGKDEPIRFAYIRACGAGWVDASFERNWKECERVGILRGPYVAMTAAAHEADPRGGPLADARVYYDALRRALGNDYGPADLPPMLDHEKGQAHAPTPDTSRLNVAVVAHLRDLIARGMGRSCGVYTGAYWQWSVPPDAQHKLSSSPLWVPDYRPMPRAGAPWSARIPDGWDKWFIRQYTSQARIPGITANTCDVNLYDGGLPALQLFVARSHITAIPWWGFAAMAGIILAVVAASFMSGGLS